MTTWAIILAALGAIGLATLLVTALGRASAHSDEEEDRLIARRRQQQAQAAKVRLELEAREHEPSR